MSWISAAVRAEATSGTETNMERAPGGSATKRRLMADLASIRESKGISLRQIADTTKISLRYLEAIERSDFDQLPGGVFNTSYIRQYARAADYNEQEILDCYACTAQQELPLPDPGDSRSKREKRSGLWRALLPRLRLS